MDGKGNAKRDVARIELADRKAEKKSARRRLLTSRMVALMGVSAALGLIFYALWFSPLFALRSESVVIDGVQSGPEYDQVSSLVEPYVGAPLLRVSTATISDDLVTQPFVADVEVTRRWPNGIHLEIDERTPVMVVQSGDDYDLLGSDGVVVATVAEAPPELVLLDLTSTDSQQRQTEAAVAHEVYDSLEPSLANKIESLSVNGEDVTLLLNTGQTVIWGTPDQSALKGQIVELLIEQRDASTYDVSDPERPSTRSDEDAPTDTE